MRTLPPVHTLQGCMEAPMSIQTLGRRRGRMTAWRLEISPMRRVEQVKCSRSSRLGERSFPQHLEQHECVLHGRTDCSLNASDATSRNLKIVSGSYLWIIMPGAIVHSSESCCELLRNKIYVNDQYADHFGLTRTRTAQHARRHGIAQAGLHVKLLPAPRSQHLVLFPLPSSSLAYLFFSLHAVHQLRWVFRAGV